MSSGASSATAGGEFAPVEVEVGEKQVGTGEGEEHEAEVIVGHVPVGGDGVEDASEDEVEGEHVGTDHPLAMDDKLPVARGEEGGQSAEEPESGQDDVRKGDDATLAKLEKGRERSRDGDGDDVDPAQDAVTLEVTSAESGGEEQGAERDGDGCGEDVRSEDEKFPDELGAVFAGLVEEREVGIEEDEEEGDAEDGPEDGLGGRAGGAGTRERGGCGGHVAPVWLEDSGAGLSVE